MKRKTDNNLTIFDEMNFRLQEKLKQAEQNLREAQDVLDEEREAFDNCHFTNEKHEYEQDVQEAQKMLDKAYAAREKIIKEIQNLEK